MELNLIELYKILADNPEGFKSVMKNIYGGELLRLRESLKETASFISEENGVDATRDRFIKQELEDLSYKFSRATVLLSFFRYVALIDNAIGKYTCEDVRVRLNHLADLINESLESFCATINGNPDNFNSKVYNMDVFFEMRENVLFTLRNIDTTLEAMDKRFNE